VSEVEKIAVICERLGASREQATTMARQLAAERGIARETALAQLLQILVEGRRGNVTAGFSPPGSK
jgi:hypothetical protein